MPGVGVPRTSDGAYGRPVRFGVLGPLEVSGEDGPVPLGGPKQRIVLAHLVLGRQPGRVRRAPDRRAVGRGASGGPEVDPAGLRLTAPIRARARRRRGAGARLRPAGRPGRGGRPTVRGPARRRPARTAPTRGRPTDPGRGARALARPGPRRPERASPRSPGRSRGSRSSGCRRSRRRSTRELDLGRHVQVIAELESLTQDPPASRTSVGAS